MRVMAKDTGLERDMDELEAKVERLKEEIQVLRERDQTASMRIGMAQEEAAKANRTIADRDAEIKRLLKESEPFRVALLTQRHNAEQREARTGKPVAAKHRSTEIGLALRKAQRDASQDDEGGEE